MASKQHHPYPTSQDEPLEKRQKAEESLSSNSTSDVHRVELNPADCGLDFDIDANGFQGSALHEKGFAYCWSGARANVGIKGGKYCFGCKIVCEQVVDMTDTPVDQRNVSRVGISRGDDSVGSLGETSHGFGFGGTGKFSNAGKFLEYGEKFGVGDIVVCAVDLEKKPLATVGFSKNGKWLGIAREFDAGSNGLGVVGTQVKKLPWESALFPHVLLKNVVVQLLFSISDGLSPIESYKPWNSAIEDGNAIFGPTFSRLEECEVLMMVGLPASGKTTWAEKWAKEHPEKRYVLLGTNLALDLMKVPGLLRKRNYGERFELLMDRATGIFNTLLARAAKTPRNYILDQTNVYKSARNRKLKSFVKYRKIAVVIFPMPDELKSRAAKRSEEMGKEVPADAVIEMLANYVLPTSKSMSSSTDSFDEVIFPELGREEAQSHLDEMKRALPTYNINIKHEFSPLSGERPAQSFPRPLVAKEEHITDFEGHGQTPLSNVLSSDYLRSSQAIPAYARPTFSSEHRPGTSDANLILFSKQAGETTQYRDYEDPAPPYHRDEISPYQTPSSTDAFLRPKLESSSPISPYGCSPTPPSYGGHGGHVHDPGTPQFVRRSAMTDQYDRMPHQTLYGFKKMTNFNVLHLKKTVSRPSGRGVATSRLSNTRDESPPRPSIEEAIPPPPPTTQHEYGDRDEIFVIDADGAQRRRMGKTTCADVQKLPPGTKVCIELNSDGVPCNHRESTLLGSYLGIIARDATLAPLSFNDWRNPGLEPFKRRMMEEIEAKFAFPYHIGNWLRSSLATKWRNHKTSLKAAHWDNRPIQEIIKNVPEGVDPVQWAQLVARWNEPRDKERSAQNIINAQQQKTHHVMGRKSYARLQKEKSTTDRLLLWKMARCRNDGRWVSHDAMQRWDLACQLLAAINLTPEDENFEENERVFREVMGPQHSGRVRTKSFGVTPSRYFPQSEESSSTCSTSRSVDTENPRYQKMEADICELKFGMSKVLSYLAKMDERSRKGNGEGKEKEPMMIDDDEE